MYLATRMCYFVFVFVQRNLVRHRPDTFAPLFFRSLPKLDPTPGVVTTRVVTPPRGGGGGGGGGAGPGTPVSTPAALNRRVAELQASVAMLREEKLGAVGVGFVASSDLLRDLQDAHTALAACCGFDLCRKYMFYWYFFYTSLSRVAFRQCRRSRASWV